MARRRRRADDEDAGVDQRSHGDLAAHLRSRDLRLEVDLTRVARMRAKKRAEFEAATGQKLNYLPFIIHSVTEGEGVPRDERLGGRNASLSQAVQHRDRRRPRVGIIVPVIKRATSSRSPDSRAP